VGSVFSTYDNVAHIPPPPDEEFFLVTFFGFLVVGLYFLGKISRKFKPLRPGFGRRQDNEFNLIVNCDSSALGEYLASFSLSPSDAQSDRKAVS
jgi:hypothetical protein